MFSDGVNIAARLQSLSQPGHITIAARTVDEATAEHDVTMEVRPLGSTDLRGKAEPMEAFELLSVAPAGTG